VLGALLGTGGVALLTDSSIGKLPLFTTKKFPAFETPPLAPGFATVTATSWAVASADTGT